LRDASPSPPVLSTGGSTWAAIGAWLFACLTLARYSLNFKFAKFFKKGFDELLK
jgi:hypothetical protein